MNVPNMMAHFQQNFGIILWQKRGDIDVYVGTCSEDLIYIIIIILKRCIHVHMVKSSKLL